MKYFSITILMILSSLVTLNSLGQTLTVNDSLFTCSTDSNQLYLKRIKEFGILGDIMDTHIDSLGNFYVAGNEITIGITTIPIVAAKFDANGMLLWTTSVSGGTPFTEDLHHMRIQTDNSLNVYVAFDFSDGSSVGTVFTLDFGNGQLITSTINTNGDTDLAVVKYSNSGQTTWAKKVSNSLNGDEFLRQLIVTPLGNSYIRSSDFITDKDHINRLDSNGTENGHISVDLVNGNNYIDFADMAVGQGGSLVVCGGLSGQYDFGLSSNLSSFGASDGFIAKYSTPANFSNTDIQWATAFGGNNATGTSQEERARRIIFDEVGNLFCTGQFSHTMSLGAAVLVAEPTPSSSTDWTDGYVAKFDGNGNPLWAKRFGAPFGDYGNHLMVHEDGRIIVNAFTGYTLGGGSFDFEGTTLSIQSNAKVVMGLQVDGSLLSFLEENAIPSTALENHFLRSREDALVLGETEYREIDFCQTNCSDSTIDSHTACDSYTWIDGNTYVTNNNTATYTLSNINGCDSVITLNLIISSVNLSVSINGTELISNNTNAGAYQWLDCNNGFVSLLGEVNSNFIAQNNGSYAVQIIENGCVDTTACYAITTVNVSDSPIIEKINIYPNPTSNKVTIELHDFKNEVECKLFSITGQEFWAYKNDLNEEKIDLEIDGENGVYFIEISSLQAVYRYMIVKN